MYIPELDEFVKIKSRSFKKYSSSSNATYHNEEEASKVFDIFTALGIECKMVEMWQVNGVGWYTTEARGNQQSYWRCWSNPFKKLLWYIKRIEL